MELMEANVLVTQIFIPRYVKIFSRSARTRATSRRAATCPRVTTCWTTATATATATWPGITRTCDTWHVSGTRSYPLWVTISSKVRQRSFLRNINLDTKKKWVVISTICIKLMELAHTKFLHPKQHRTNICVDNKLCAGDSEYVNLMCLTNVN